MSSKTVIGIFENENEAQQAVQTLVNQGFDRNDVDIASRNTTQTTSAREDDDEGYGSSISNFFSSLFGTDDDNTSRYSEVAKRGYTVVVHAHSDSDAERAADMLDEYGAVNIDEKANQYRNADTDTTARIPIIEENLEVGKKEVETGGARIRSRIVEKPVEESVRLRSEHVNIERNPVNREASEADFNTFKEGTIEMKEHKEVPVVGKEARVKEEISLNKEVEETEETIRDTVRSTEVDIEKLDEDEDERLRNERLRNPNLYTRNENDLDDENDSFKKNRDYDL